MERLKPAPAPNLYPKEAPNPDPLNAEDRAAADLFGLFLGLICRITDLLCRIYISSLNNDVWTKFTNPAYQAPIPPWYFTATQREKCNPKIIDVFCKVMANYQKPGVKNDHILSYTRYSNALEGKSFDQECHNALSKSIDSWLLEKETMVQIGRPYDEVKNNRRTISSDFIKAALPLLRKYPNLKQIHISGPINEKDLPLIKTGLIQATSLRKIHLEVDKKSAEYLTSALPNILKNRNITEISLRNFDKKEKFSPIQDDTWRFLKEQKNCKITFTNIPEPSKPHNNLTFN